MRFGGEEHLGSLLADVFEPQPAAQRLELGQGGFGRADLNCGAVHCSSPLGMPRLAQPAVPGCSELAGSGR